MHHTPAGPSPSERARGVLAGLALLLRSALPGPARRSVPVLLAGLAVAAVALAVPLASGAVSRAPVSLDASSSAGATHHTGGSPVVMGEDGAPASGASAFSAAGPSSAGAAADQPTTSSTGATAATGDEPAAAPDPGTTTASTSSAPSSTSASSAASSAVDSSADSSSGSAPSSSSDSPEALVPVPDAGDAVLASVNAARAAERCAPLSSDGTLTDRAENAGVQMSATGSLAAVDPAGPATLVQQGAGDATAAVAAWLADPADRTRLLDCSLTTGGAAEATGDSGPWWTLVLA